MFFLVIDNKVLNFQYYFSFSFNLYLITEIVLAGLQCRVNGEVGVVNLFDKHFV